MMKLTQKKPAAFDGDLVAFFVQQPESGPPVCAEDGIRPTLERAFECGDFSGKEGQTLLYYPEPTGAVRAKRVLIVGLGKEELTRETFRKGGGTVASAALKTKARRILVVVPDHLEFSLAEITECLAEGLMLGAYQFRKYKTEQKKEEEPGRLDEILLYSAKPARARQCMKSGMIAGRP